MIRVIDSYNGINEIFSGRTFQIDKWKEYVDNISSSLYRKCIDDISKYDFKSQVLPIIEYALSSADIMELAHDSFGEMTYNINEKLMRVLGREVEADIILYLGLGSGAGWATDIENRPTVLLGIEKIVELGWYDNMSMAALIYHELGHLWHFQCRKANWFSDEDRDIWHLYTEGIAMYAEQNIMGNADFFHQDDGEWLKWCKDNRTKLFKEYLRRVQLRESVQDFFGDWCSYQGHSDVGYYLGGVIVRSLSQGMDNQQLCDCDAEQIKEQLYVFSK